MSEKYIDYEKLGFEKSAHCSNELGMKLSELAGEQITANLLAIKTKFPKEIIEKTIEEVISENDVHEHIKDRVRKYLEVGSADLVEK